MASISFAGLQGQYYCYFLAWLLQAALLASRDHPVSWEAQQPWRASPHRWGTFSYDSHRLFPRHSTVNMASRLSCAFIGGWLCVAGASVGLGHFLSLRPCHSYGLIQG